MPRILAFSIAIAIIYFIPNQSGGSVGVSSQCVNSNCVVTASSSISGVVLGLLLAILVFFFPRKRFIENSDGVVGLWRRFGAFILDFIVILTIISPAASLPILITESGYTGGFEWSFTREFSRDSDNILILPVIFGMFAIIFLYFYVHAKSGNQTFGQYILNYVVSSSEDGKEPQFAKRVLYSYIGLCAWPVSVILALRSENKECWWDKTTNTKLVKGS
ncbi:MAG: RDD family protein [Cellvibrionaceae bacterium]|nr:RDD family protein [Cellvibrionaceae bacterium]